VDEATFKRLVGEFLLPMFPGASLGLGASLRPRVRQTVSYSKAGGGSQLLLRPDSKASFEFAISRSQKFGQADLDLARAFVRGAADVADAIQKPFEAEVLRNLPLRVVALAAGGTGQAALLAVLEKFSAWAAEQYEGRPIVAAVGIDPSASGTVDIASVWKEVFAPVLTNGLDTILVVDANSRVAELLAAAIPSKAPPSFSPSRYRSIAEWATGERIAVSLNRNGEILVFRDQSLRFTLRAGIWQHFTHQATLSAIHLPHKRAVKQALYETLLDVSFARSGGCLAVVDEANRHTLINLVSPADFLVPTPPATQSTKGELIFTAVGRDFTQLDRRVRAELLALDGATIIDHLGTLLAVGAIVRIQAGSTAGGRLAAAKTLARLGLGVKISQDGQVRGFDSSTNEVFTFG
jgi:hypothetical protein